MGRRLKILVVEDNSSTRSMIEFALEFEGYEVKGLPDGLAVADELASELPDLVILDVMMPGRDGFAVLQDIRGSERTRGIPVLMLTALDDAESTWRGWSQGCDYFMNKPFDTNSLLGTVHRLLEEAA